jgi:hypothetical protein
MAMDRAPFTTLTSIPEYMYMSNRFSERHRDWALQENNLQSK